MARASDALPALRLPTHRQPLALPDGCFTLLDTVETCSRPPITLANDATVDELGPLLPFFVQLEDRQPIGWLRPAVVDALRADNASMAGFRTDACFVFADDGSRCAWSDAVNADGIDGRTEHMDRLARKWRQAAFFPDQLDGWRDEVYAIWAPKDPQSGPLPGSNVAFFCERAACSLFGFATFGVHLTGYTVDDTKGERSIWVARRSKNKQTWPGLLDQTVAGGITATASPLESIVREAMEEASLDSAFVLERIQPAGVVAYTTRTRPVGWWQPETQYVYDLRFDAPSQSGAIRPRTNDSEVDGFELMTESDALASAIRGEWKPNCALVLIDFLIRHGRITAESDARFVDVCAALRRGIGDLPAPA